MCMKGSVSIVHGTNWLTSLLYWLLRRHVTIGDTNRKGTYQKVRAFDIVLSIMCLRNQRPWISQRHPGTLGLCH